MKKKIITAFLAVSLLAGSTLAPAFAEGESKEDVTEISKTVIPTFSRFTNIMDFEKTAGENESVVFTMTKKGDTDIPMPVVFAAHFDKDGTLENIDKFNFTKNGDTYTAIVDKQTGAYRLFVWTDDAANKFEPVTVPLTAADDVFGELQKLAKEQSIGLTGVGNARELGGYAAADGRTVKHGVFLRTAALAGASDEDIQKLKDDYNLSEVIDLRMSREIDSKPDPEIDGVKNLQIGIIDEELMAKRREEIDPSEIEGYDPSDRISALRIAIKIGIVGEEMYINFLSTDKGKAGYKKMFEELLSLPEGKSLLFHCTQGKDRTGLAAMLILSALGVDEDTIMQDFMLTNIFNAKLIESERNMLIEKGFEGEELQAIMTCMDAVAIHAECAQLDKRKLRLCNGIYQQCTRHYQRTD